MKKKRVKNSMASPQNVDQTIGSHQIAANLGKLVLMHWDLSVVGVAKILVLYIQIRSLFTILKVIIGGENETVTGDFEWRGGRGGWRGHG